MSLVIKDMKMPKAGRLTLQISTEGSVYIVNHCNITAETYTTTAVSIPPHGRLIDADVLYEVVKKRTRNWAGGWSDIECVLTGNDIKNAPTIIEAEEGD